MKKYFPLLLFVFCLISLKGQPGYKGTKDFPVIGQYQEEYYNSTWNFYDSATFQYNTSQQLVSDYGVSPVQNVWDTVERDIYTYDTNGNELTWTIQSFDATFDTFINIQRYYMQYTNNDNTYYANQTWDTTDNTWLSTMQVFATYDNNHHKLTDTAKYWNTASNQEEYGRYYTYTYTSNGKLAVSTEYLWTNESWQPVELDSLSWGGITDTILAHYTALWDTITNSFIANMVHMYDYDAYGHEVNDAQYSWMNNKWVTYSMDSTRYDAQGHRLWAMIFLGNLDSLWGFSQLDSALYDSINKWEVDRWLYWNITKWQYSTLDTFYLDNNGLTIESAFYSYSTPSDTWNIYSLNYYVYDIYENETFFSWWSSSGPIIRGYYYYNYGTVTNTEDAADEFTCGVYPNPAGTNYIHVRFCLNESAAIQITIFDECGRRLLVQNSYGKAGNNDIPIPIGNLTAGEYFLSATDRSGGKSCTLKWIKE